MKKNARCFLIVGLLAASWISGHCQATYSRYQILQLPDLADVRIRDSFWSPKLATWSTKTINDVFDKFEGKYVADRNQLIQEDHKLGRTRDAFRNFDLVAQGQKGIGKHDGPEWYDGLVYESIRAAADLLSSYPDSVLEKRVDGYIDRIAAAQAADSDGYLMTHTILMEPAHRWGLNGGFERGQHDVYNAGMLTEAAVHYYKATGKTKLLEVAVKLCNYMFREMGPAPKKNIIPGHAGPEEALMKLYWLFKESPSLKEQILVPVDENNYYALVKWWIEGRGKNCGLPDWDHWEYKKSDRWIRDAAYNDPKYGNHSRPSWGSYDQDQSSVFTQKTIEGHAVRATLLATGIATAAMENKEGRYLATADNYWNNMVGKRLFITGGVGALAHEEAFGPDYILPEDAYLETCAAVGAGFFSQRMNQLEANGQYVDELERSLYNNILSGISMTGDHYYYENPLISNGRTRWNWHECPCCPPMFLKMIGALPQFIYAYDNKGIYINLFIGSDVTLKSKGTEVFLNQETSYPIKGQTVITVNPTSPSEFAVHLRIPGWARGKENPFGLYHSNLKSTAALKVNGKSIPLLVSNGYATINRKWRKGDKIELNLPIKPRLVYANKLVDTLRKKAVVAAGPLVYCFENTDNAQLDKVTIDAKSALRLDYDPALLGGANVIKLFNKGNAQANAVAIPFYLVGNRAVNTAYRVWIPVKDFKE